MEDFFSTSIQPSTPRSVRRPNFGPANAPRASSFSRDSTYTLDPFREPFCWRFLRFLRESKGHDHSPVFLGPRNLADDDVRDPKTPKKSITCSAQMRSQAPQMVSPLVRLSSENDKFTSGQQQNPELRLPSKIPGCLYTGIRKKQPLRPTYTAYA